MSENNMQDNNVDNIEDNEQDRLNEILNDDIDLEEGNGNTDLEEELVVYDDRYQINAGDALNCKEVYQIAAKEQTKMVVFTGPVGSGKTTIEASIYQLFQRAPVDKLYFAGSKTIQGYEQRVFFTRLSSKGNKPETPRTSRNSDNVFLHLRIWQSDRERYNNLLFADLSGESFETHIGQVEQVKTKFAFIDRADYIIGVLDGVLLQDKRKIQSTVTGMCELIRTFYDAELINEECVLQVVFSKCDKLYELENARQIIDRVKRLVEGRLKELLSRIEYFEVAAMPEKVDKVEIGYGLKEMLYSWIGKRQLLKKNKEKIPFHELSEFDRLYNKFLGVAK